MNVNIDAADRIGEIIDLITSGRLISAGSARPDRSARSRRRWRRSGPGTSAASSSCGSASPAPAA